LCTSRHITEIAVMVKVKSHIDGERGHDGGSDVLMSHDDGGRLICGLLVVEVLREHGGVLIFCEIALYL
jgi:hypothetical protein